VLYNVTVRRVTWSETCMNRIAECSCWTQGHASYVNQLHTG